MRRVRLRLQCGLVFLAWFAQLCLPLAHAAVMAAAPAQTMGWCGDPTRARAFIAELPAELQPAFEVDQTSEHQLEACAQLCTVATTPPPLPTLTPSVVLRAAGLEPAPAPRLAPIRREAARRPPSQGPPGFG